MRRKLDSRKVVTASSRKEKMKRIQLCLAVFSFATNAVYGLNASGQTEQNWTLDEEVFAPDEARFQVQFYYYVTRQWGTLCGGSFITARTILTAAHCVYE